LAEPSFYPYRAFVSYSHQDKQWCDWLHRRLENFRISSDLAGRVTHAGPVPRNLRPIFRDRADFSAGPLQAQSIDALKNSQFLIVIASPHSAASDYVNEEIRLFKSFGGEGRVLSLIVAGEPPACFAPAPRLRVAADGELTEEPTDQVGADIAKDGKREALVKIVAALVDLPYDVLWQRDVKAQRIRMVSWVAVAVMIIAAALGGYEHLGVRHEVVRLHKETESEAKRIEYRSAGRAAHRHKPGCGADWSESERAGERSRKICGSWSGGGRRAAEAGARPVRAEEGRRGGGLVP
jgi:eukaryotic-like serine/threonine-protein kinase